MTCKYFTLDSDNYRLKLDMPETMSWGEGRQTHTIKLEDGSVDAFDVSKDAETITMSGTFKCSPTSETTVNVESQTYAELYFSDNYNTWISQPIKIQDDEHLTRCTGIDLYVNKQGTVDTCKIHIKETQSGPTLYSWDYDISNIIAGNHWEYFAFSPNAFILPEKEYYFIISQDGTDTSNELQIAQSLSDRYYGNAATSVDKGKTWTEHTSYDLSFKLHGYYVTSCGSVMAELEKICDAGEIVTIDGFDNDHLDTDWVISGYSYTVDRPRNCNWTLTLERVI